MGSRVAEAYIDITSRDRLAGGLGAVRGNIQASIAGMASMTASLIGAQVISRIAAMPQQFFMSMINLNAQMEDYQISMGVMLKSTSAAKKMLQDLQGFAAATPFEMPQVVKGAQQILRYGFVAKEIIPILRDVGDAASAAPEGMAYGMERIVRALGQIKQAGRLRGGEMRQLTEAGIDAWTYLANYLHKTVPEVQAISRKGAIDATTAIAAIRAGIRDTFGERVTFFKESDLNEGARTLIKTMSAAGKVTAESLEQLRAQGVDSMAGLAAGLKMTIPELQAAMAQGKVSFKDFADAMGENLGFERIAGMMEQKSHTFTGMWSNFSDFMGISIRTMGAKLFKTVGDVMSKMLEFIQSQEGKDLLGRLTEGFNTFMGVVIRFGPPIAAFAAGFLTFLGAAVGGNAVLGTIGTALTALVSPAGLLAVGFATLGMAIYSASQKPELWERIKVAVQGVWETVKSVAGRIAQAWQTMGSRLGPVWDRVVIWVVGALEKVATFITENAGTWADWGTQILQIVNGAIEVLIGAWQWFTGILGEAWTGLMSMMGIDSTDTWGSIRDFITTVLEEVNLTLNTWALSTQIAWVQMKLWAAEAWHYILNLVKGKIADQVGFFAYLSGAFKQAMLIMGVDIDKIVNSFINAWTTISNFFGSVIHILSSWWVSFINTVAKAWNFLVGNVSKATVVLEQQVTPKTDVISGIGTKAVEEFGRKQAGLAQKGVDALDSIHQAGLDSFASARNEVIASLSDIGEGDLVANLRQEMNKLLAERDKVRNELRNERAGKPGEDTGAGKGKETKDDEETKKKEEEAAADKAMKFAFIGFAEMGKKTQEALTGQSPVALQKLQLGEQKVANTKLDNLTAAMNSAKTILDKISGQGGGFGQ